MVIFDSHVQSGVRTSNSSAFPLNFKIACEGSYGRDQSRGSCAHMLSIVSHDLVDSM